MAMRRNRSLHALGGNRARASSPASHTGVAPSSEEKRRIRQQVEEEFDQARATEKAKAAGAKRKKMEEEEKKKLKAREYEKDLDERMAIKEELSAAESLHRIRQYTGGISMYRSG